jgi:acetyl esterase/lipase
MDTIETRPQHTVETRDIEYQRQGGQAMLARLYQPSGTGPFPAALQVHGGAWTSKDRTDNDFMAKALAENGIVVLSIDFRMPPHGGYPAALQDINLGVRWLKAHATDFHSKADWVGSFGTSSGGHLVLLAGMRPDDKRYAALPLAAAPAVDARQAFVISGWGVLCPKLRYNLAKTAGNAQLVKNHDSFWGSEEAMGEASPPLMLERGEKCALPPALVFGGDADEWVPLDLMRRFAEDYRKAGGTLELVLYPEANHSFMTGKPDARHAGAALAAMQAFIRKHAF